MLFSVRLDVALRILDHLRHVEVAKVPELAAVSSASLETVSKVAQSLVRLGYLAGTRGPAGGYSRVHQEPIRVSEIVTNIEGELASPVSPILWAIQELVLSELDETFV